jgi:peptidase M23-like protein
MALGTPVLAGAAGTVAFAGVGASFSCPLLGKVVTDQNLVQINHVLPGGIGFQTHYVHLDTVLVSKGQTVTEGQQIGTVGKKGCALNPHLHFRVLQTTGTRTGSPTVVDPYGWTGAGTDPWAAAADGAESRALFKRGEAPDLFRRFDVDLNPNSGDTQFVGITRVQFQGVRDDENPDNEFIEVTRDNRFAPATLDLTGFTISGKAGVVFTFPAGFTLVPGRETVRVYMGTGTSTDAVLYAAHSAGVLDNRTECVELHNAANLLRTRVGWGAGCP